LKSLVSRKLTPFANLAFCEHLFAAHGGNFSELLASADSGLTYLKDLRTNGFSKGTEWEVKLLVLKCKALTSKRVDISREKKAKEFAAASKRMQELVGSTQNAKLISQEMPLMLYNQKLSEEGLKGAREFLDEFEKGSLGFDRTAIKEDWVKAQKAWLTYSFIDDITKDRAEQVQIVQSVMVLLKEAVAINPENIEAQIRLGTVILFYEKELGIPAKQASL